VPTLKRIFVGSLFVAFATILAFLLYHSVNETIRSANDAVSEGPGYYNAYTRFVPTDFEPGVSAALDLALSCLLAAGLFYGIAGRKWARNNALTPTEAPKTATKANAGFARTKQRLWLIPVWFVAQYGRNLFSGMSTGQALGAMTSIGELWISALVIAVIVLYANNYQVVFGDRDAKKPESIEKPAAPKP
jgi:hypothetical protein